MPDQEVTPAQIEDARKLLDAHTLEHDPFMNCTCGWRNKPVSWDAVRQHLAEQVAAYAASKEREMRLEVSAHQLQLTAVRKSTAATVEYVEGLESQLHRFQRAAEVLIESYKCDGEGTPPTYGRPSIHTAWVRLRTVLSETAKEKEKSCSPKVL